MAEQLDRAKLAKLMGMATSDQDGEALTALRMANKLIAGAKMSWAELLGFSASARPPGSAFRDSQRAYEREQRWGEAAGAQDFSAARKNAEDFGEALRRYNSTASNVFERAMQSEKADIAKHRVMLDEVLKRELPRGKMEHFLSIQRLHVRTGAISTNHRAQIARAFYSQDGWDRPLGENNA